MVTLILLFTLASIHAADVGQLQFGQTGTTVGSLWFNIPAQSELFSDSFDRMNKQLGFSDGLAYGDSTLGQGGYWYSLSAGIDANGWTNNPTFEQERFAVTDLGTGMVRASVEVTRGAAGGTNGLCLNVDSSRLWFTNYIRCYYNGDASILVDSVVNNNATNLITYGITYADGLKLDCASGMGQVKLYHNSNLVGRASIDWQFWSTNTSHGIYNVNGASAAHLDNFVILTR